MVKFILKNCQPISGQDKDTSCSSYLITIEIALIELLCSLF